jgi:hypothetical protein
MGARKDYVILAVGYRETTVAPYWLPGGKTYTDSITEAAFYTRKEAHTYTQHCKGLHEPFCVTSKTLAGYLSHISPIRSAELALWLRVQAVEPAWELIRPRETATEPPMDGQRCFVYTPFQSAGWFNAGYEQNYLGRGPHWVAGGGHTYPAAMFKWWVPELGEPVQVKAYLQELGKKHRALVKAHKNKKT